MATTTSSVPSSDSSLLIDERRSQQLMERALALAERGDIQSAVLSCRQSISLAPESSQAYSMLGILLERAGDTGGAIAAYERVLQLSPDSVLERESLSRLRATAAQRRTTRNLFVFDDNELFGDERPEELPSTISDREVDFSPEPPVGEGDDISQAVLDAAATETVTAAWNEAPLDTESRADPFRVSDAGFNSDSISEPGSSSSAPSSASSVGEPGAKLAAAATAGNQAAVALDGKAVVVPVNAAAIGDGSTRAAAAAAAAGSKIAERTPVAGAGVLSTTPFPGASSYPAPAGRAPTVRPANVAPATFNPTYDAPAPKPLSPLQKLLQRPTFYFRSAPLAGATMLSLVLLLWAHNHATTPGTAPGDVALGAPVPVAVNPAPAPDVVAKQANPAQPEAAGGAQGVVPTNPGSGNAADSSSSISAPVAVNPGTPSTSAAPAPAPSGQGGARPTSTVVGRPTPPAAGRAAVPGVATPPQNTAPAAVGSPGQPPAGGSSTQPVSSGGASTGGAPVNTSGSPNREVVRVAPGAARPAVRPESRAAGDETAAGADAQSGRPNAALERLSRAIESGGEDIAFRLQQRAQLYLQSGDGSRAIADFQSAIGAYNDMIGRGDRVAMARSGIASCQRGIQLAQARR